MGRIEITQCSVIYNFQFTAYISYSKLILKRGFGSKKGVNNQ